MSIKQPSDLIRVNEARSLLGVSHTKISKLIKDGHLRCYPNVLDGRQKLVSKAEVLALKPRRTEAA